MSAEPASPPPDAPGMPERAQRLTALLRAIAPGVLFVATAASVVAAQGVRFAMALLAILLTHEAGHYVAARRHGVPSSLPLFIPFPYSQLGTLGAVIMMRARVRSRVALFDIGAAGPLAGLVVAVPVLVYGMVRSTIIEVEPGMFIEGRSLAYVGIRTLVHGPLGPGQDVLLAPEAFAGWAGLLVTMINLVPVGQLDGGHVARALFGVGYRHVEPWVHRTLLAVGVGVSTMGVVEAVRATGHAGMDDLLGMHWMVWYLLLHMVRRAGPLELDDETPLGPTRRALAGFTLALFPLLFMPWWARID